MEPLPGYSLDLDAIAAQLKEADIKRVAVQLPEGLRHRHAALLQAIATTAGVEVVYLADHTFGACDLVTDLKPLGAQALLHIGHNRIHATPGQKTIYVPLESLHPIDTVVTAAIPQLRSPVVLCTTSQHLPKLGQMEQILKDAGLEVRTADGGRGCQSGQVLGCHYGAVRNVAAGAASVLFVGSGEFHPLGLALACELPLIVADPYTKEVRTVEQTRDRILRQRNAAIARSYDATHWGVIVGTKSGQIRTALGLRCQALLHKAGHQADLLAVTTLSPEVLLGFPQQAFVSVSCPRIAIDDAARYDRPILTPPELEIHLGLRAWEDYLFDEFP